MTAFALIQIACILLLPVGLYVVFRSAAYPRPRLAILIGLALVIASLPALWFCRYCWPPDYLLPGGETRVTERVPGYEVTLVNQPGFDFYETYFEVRRSDGKTTRLVIDYDDNKWWHPKVAKKGSRIYFLHGRDRITSETSCINLSDGTLHTRNGEYYKLSGLNFREPWN